MFSHIKIDSYITRLSFQQYLKFIHFDVGQKSIFKTSRRVYFVHVVQKWSDEFLLCSLQNEFQNRKNQRIGPKYIVHVLQFFSSLHFFLFHSQEVIFGNCSCFPAADKLQTRNLSATDQQSPPNVTKTTLSQQMMNDSSMDKIKYMKMKRKSFFNEATIGKCDRNCKNFFLFIGITICFVLISFISSTPHKIMLLRYVGNSVLLELTKLP